MVNIFKKLLTLLALTVVLTTSQALAANRIVALNGDITEIIFALGAEAQLVAVDATSNYPEAANTLPNIGYAGRLSAESIMAFEPDLVIATGVAGPKEVLDQLAAAGVNVVIISSETTLATPVENIRQVAALVGAEEQGEVLAQEIEAKIALAAQRGSELASPPRVLFLYLGSKQMQFVGGRNSASNVMIEGAGGIDVGAEAGFVGFMPFTPEAVIAAAPHVLVVTERGVDAMGGIDAIFEIPGIAETPAAQNRHLLVYEDLYFIGMGPRTADALLELAEDLHDLQ